MSRIPATTFRALLRYLPGLGIDRDAALRGTGVDPDSIAHPRATIESSSLRALLRNLLELSGQPARRLVPGRGARINAFGVSAYAMLSCPELDGAARSGMRIWGAAGAGDTSERIESDTKPHWRPPEAVPLGDLWQFAV